MPAESFFSREVLGAATTSRRWAGLTRFTADLATLRTWDRGLSRRRRILVPVDVQAFVVGPSGEPVVGLVGTSDDPAPFTAGAPLAPGVHLHWAMPDALLRGSATADGGDLSLPELPDRWVVVRTVNRSGERTSAVTGWVINAAEQTVTKLDAWSGDPESSASVTGLAGGSLLASATYLGSTGRSALHDPLEDLTDDLSQGLLSSNRATYTVAGWWSRPIDDPLHGSSWGLLSRMETLSWGLTPDGEGRLLKDRDPREMRLSEMSGATSDSGRVTTTTVTRYGTDRSLGGDISPRLGVPFEGITNVVVGAAATRYAALLHGSVVGVPLAGQGGLDEAPRSERMAASVGLDVDDIAAAFAAPHLRSGAPADRLTGERLLAAFTGNLLVGLGEPDGLDDLEDREHTETFDSAPGPPLPSARPDTLCEQDALPRGPLAVGRKGRSAQAGQTLSARLLPEVRRGDGGIGWSGLIEHTAVASAREREFAKRASQLSVPSTKKGGAGGKGRERIRPAPRMFRPAAPMIGLRGVRPHPRHHGDGLYDDAGILRCRYPGEAVPGIEGTVEGVLLVPTLGSGAVPPEMVSLVREAVLLDPWADPWLAAAANTDDDASAFGVRLAAERVRLLGNDGSYDPSGRSAVVASRWAAAQPLDAQPLAAPQVRAIRQVRAEMGSPLLASVASDLARYSLLRGSPPSPVALTIWRQPWVPVFLEWQVTVRGTDTLAGWELTGRDLTGRGGTLPEATITRTITGRAPISRGVGTALIAGIRRWLDAEAERDLAATSSSVLSDPDEEVLATIATLLDPLEVVGASLDGVREDLLGIDYQALLTMTATDDTSEVAPRADRNPIPLFGGTLSVDALRVVDAFGRTRDVPVAEVATTSTRELPGTPASIVIPPRLQHGARWLLRLVDPAHALSESIDSAPEANVNQVTSTLMVNPISGFLLPDHIDESLEFFDAAGQPLGEVLHDPLSGAVTWSPAPGRPLPPDAAPLDGLPQQSAQHVALLATGLVTSDVQTRAGATAPSESTLTAFLRAVDTTLHSIDAYAGVGAPTIAGLVGRPIAVVRASVRLDAPDDVDQVEVTAVGGPDARREAFTRLARERVQLRIGELSRTDDATLGFFVDDDYSRFHVVDKAVASAARQVGRHRGYLGLLGTFGVPGEDPLDHPYLVTEDTLSIQIGQVRSLTILMLPAGRAHLVSGLTPRKALTLAEDWVTAALRRMSPSVRIGPVLVDPAQIRLPTVSTLADDQVFTRRTGGLSWRDDPITSATSAALLPPMPHEVQEGWIRVAPPQLEGQEES